MNSTTKIILLVVVVIVSITSLFFIDAIPQDPRYHDFADTRWLGFIPNASNVLSNGFFLIVGALGLFKSFTHSLSGSLPHLNRIYQTIFIGVFFTGIGSAYYHWSPDNSTLVWDRLPMAIAFMALFAMVIGEQLSEELALTVFGPLVAFGVFSVAYWHFTEQKGLGDLRIYILVQFLPLLLIPLLLILFASPFHSSAYIWSAIACYGLSKAFELSDETLFNLGFGLSGHSLKHVLAAFGAGSILWGLQRRRAHPQTVDG